MQKLSLFTGILSILWICGDKAAEPKLFRRLPSSQTGITFANRITESDSLNVLTFEYLYNGGGVGIGDFDRDGRQDVYFSGNQVSGRLYLNRTATDEDGSPLRFEDITEAAGVRTDAWCTGVAVADVNSDGWPDIYLSVAGVGQDTSRRANLLFINETKTPSGPVVFREQARAYGLADTGYSTQTAFLDYDHDGDLDAYVLTNALDRRNRNAIRPKRVRGEAPSNDRLYRNEGLGPNGHPYFTDVTRRAGILLEGYGLGIAVADLNGDGWEDIYCANDFLSNDLVWINNRNGLDGETAFTNQAAAYLKHQSHNAMGVDIADVNNDHLPDIMVVDMLPNTNERQKMMLPGYNYDRFRMDLRMGYEPQYMRNTLQLGMGDGKWSEVSQLAGVDKTDWSWAPLFADFDNDGYRDLLITNGYRRDVTNLDFTAYLADLGAGGFGDTRENSKKAYRQLSGLPEVKLTDFCYRNRGDLTFEDVSDRWGFDQPSYSNGAAYADLDNDGDLDIVINTIDGEAFVYENTLQTPASDPQKTPPSWLRVGLERRPAYGTKVSVYYGGKSQTAEFNPTRGYLSSVEPFLHFGLGNTSLIDSVVVRWNNRRVQRYLRVRPNQLLRVDYRPQGVYDLPQPAEPAFFRELSPTEAGLDYVHVENEFNDFARTPLQPHKHSQNGPPLAVGDVDGDGRDDVYIGADFGHSGYLYRQSADGRFRRTEISKPGNQEDTAALFFDADGDGDPDLYVVSGGSHVEGESPAYGDRLYRNNGHGEFVRDRDALPRTGISGSCIVAGDLDKDGDLDLFRGGRLLPGKYPTPVNSLILRNENGRFRDATAQIAPELRALGLVTSAVWADFDGDSWPDLAVCGEWMPITIFGNKSGRLRPSGQNPGEPAAPAFTRSFTSATGWWNTLLAHDFDGDGDVDLMAGNLGLNTKFKASPEHPISVYAGDFDGNGSLDPVMTHYNGNRQYLTAPRDLLAFQIPSMKRRFPDFRSYARATFEESFTPDEIRSAYHRSTTEFRSVYLENTGRHQFVAHPLPTEAQFAPVYGIRADDFNHDGHQDALLVGNSYASETIGGWYDASPGTLLLGNGRGAFRTARNSGIMADRDAKGMAALRRTDGSTWLLIANNNDRLQLFQSRPKPPVH